MAANFVGTYRQGSREVLDYTIDWSSVMTAESASVADSEWFAEQGSPVFGDGNNGGPAPSYTGTSATVWVVEGTIGDVLHITNVVTDSDGRKHEASISIEIIDK